MIGERTALVGPSAVVSINSPVRAAAAAARAQIELDDALGAAADEGGDDDDDDDDAVAPSPFVRLVVHLALQFAPIALVMPVLPQMKLAYFGNAAACAEAQMVVEVGR